jgi:hypothetical protein
MSPSNAKGKKADAHPDKRLQEYFKKIWVFLGHNLPGGILVGVILLVVQALLRPSPAPIDGLMKKEAILAAGNYPHSEKELEEYAGLFSSDAIVLDYKTGDVWKGRNAIKDRIRPLHFTTLHHTSSQIQIDDADASAQTNTTFMQDKPTLLPGIGREIWQFRKINGAWKIISFEYDLP